MVVFCTSLFAAAVFFLGNSNWSKTLPEPVYQGRPLSETLKNDMMGKARGVGRAIPREQLESYIEHVLDSRDSTQYAALHSRMPAWIQQRLPRPERPSKLYPGAIVLLSELKPPTETQAQLFRRYLTHDSELVREFAVQGLLEMLAGEPVTRHWGVMDAKMIDALMRFSTKNTNQLAQCQAVNALMLLNADLRPVAPTIEQLIHRRSPFDDFQQNVGLLAAWRLTPDAAQFSNVCHRLRSPTPDRTRSTMAVLIGQLGSIGAPFRELLEQNTLDRSYSVRKTATNALRSIAVSK